jgi:hypothetical protein
MVVRYQTCRGTYCLHSQGRKIGHGGEKVNDIGKRRERFVASAVKVVYRSPSVAIYFFSALNIQAAFSSEWVRGSIVG